MSELSTLTRFFSMLISIFFSTRFFFRRHWLFTGQQRKRRHHLCSLPRALWCSGYHYCTTSFNKACTKVLRRFKSCSRRVADSLWWGSLTMAPAGNKAKSLSSVNYTTKIIYHHYHHFHPLTNIKTFVISHVRWLSGIFNRTACNYQTAIRWDLPPYWITIMKY